MIFKTVKPFILASASPRRKELLERAGISLKIHPSTVEEPAPKGEESPIEYSTSLALLKAREVFSRFPGKTVLGADTVVVCQNKILGKPEDRDDAIKMLSMLSGNTHMVITGCALIDADGVEKKFWAQTEVDFIDCNLKTMKAYAATGEPDDKAGAYAIQGQGAFLVKEVRGSYTNVVGLPLAKVIKTLVSYGVIVPGDG